MSLRLLWVCETHRWFSCGTGGWGGKRAVLKRMGRRDASSASTPVLRASSMSMVSFARGGGLARPVLARSACTLGVSSGTSAAASSVIPKGFKRKARKSE